ncbi:MAG: hypothetical protein ACTSXO_01100 [Candidatus Heimdallarchaeota archaeon]
MNELERLLDETGEYSSETKKIRCPSCGEVKFVPGYTQDYVCDNGVEKIYEATRELVADNEGKSYFFRHSGTRIKKTKNDYFEAVPEKQIRNKDVRDV